ncbi:MAG: IPT/TIG domain-containing protein, partial [Acidobacteriota bacterium]
MSPAKVRSRDGYTVDVNDSLLHTPLDAPLWQSQTIGSAIRFRVKLGLVIFLANPAKTCCLFVITSDGSTLVTEPAAPVITEVSDGAGFQPLIAPNGWVVIKGSDLAATTRSWTQSDFRGQAMPTVLDGTSVTINGKPAYVYYISPTQLNVLAPGDTSEGTVSVEVTTRLGTGRTLARLQKYAPGLFMQDADGRKYVAAVHATGGIVGRAGLYPSSPNFTRPLLTGGRAQLYTSGFGPTEPAQPEGLLFSNARAIVGAEHLRVSIGGQPAQVEFAGAVSPGLYQINIVAPAALASGDHLVQVDFGSFRTQANAFITIQGTSAPAQMSVSPGALSFSSLAGQTSPSPATLLVSSSTGALDFAASVEGNPRPNWLTVNPGSGRTPANLIVSVNIAGLTPGVYSASIRVVGAGANAVSIPVSLTLTSPPVSSAVIQSLSPSNGFPNELLPTFTVTGTGLGSVTGIEFEPPAGVAVNSVRATATQVTAQVLVAGNAPINTRMVTVVTPTGRSNALPFQILVPSVVPTISNV